MPSNGNPSTALQISFTVFSERLFVAIREEKKMSAKKPIAIKLLCPSLSIVVRLLVASDEQRIDLGSIAQAFGLEPSTIKLNGHFISRGVDLVASSVTWKSLLSFFSAKGLPTGKDDGDALDVTGKLCKAGKKRKSVCYLYIYRHIKRFNYSFLI